MAQTVRLSHDYSVPAEQLWDVATDWDCLRQAVSGLVEYDSLPDVPLHEGQIIHTNVSLFGRLPAFPYTMEVREFDAQNMRVRSHEYGGAVKAWDHTLVVEPLSTGSRLNDEIVIDAGLMTPLYALWAKFMYRRRHKPRLAMLGIA